MLYGVWHPDKYAVVVCYRRLFALFVFLTQGRLPSGTEVFPHPKLIYMERVMAALLVLVSSCKPALARLKASAGDARPDMSERQRSTIALVKGRVVLLLEYTLAVFLCGSLVRNCSWANQQNSDDALQAARETGCLVHHWPGYMDEGYYQWDAGWGGESEMRGE